MEDMTRFKTVVTDPDAEWYNRKWSILDTKYSEMTRGFRTESYALAYTAKCNLNPFFFNNFLKVD